MTSLGLNEQELAFLSTTAGGPYSGKLSAQPELSIVKKILKWMLSTFGRTVGNPSATLTRIHFHSLTYHVIATVRDTWQNSLSAVTAGARAASLQACDTSSFANDKFSLKIPKSLKLSESIALKFDPHKPGISWEEEDLEFSFSPVLVCKEPTRTVGLGDAISATGLMYSYRTNL